ncbi:MAG: hypothetical protein AAFV43_00170 [Planctomycetota bacterium]
MPSYEWRLSLVDAAAEQPMLMAAVGLAACAAISSVAYAARRERDAAEGRVLATVTSLRLLALVGLAVLALGLERRPLSVVSTPSVVALMTDVSASMTLSAGVSSGPSSNDTSRQEVAHTLAELVGEALASEHEVAMGRFAGAVAWRDTDDPQPTGTRLDAAIDGALRELGPRPVGGVVLLSDGRTDAVAECRSAAERAAESDVSVCVVGIGPAVEPSFVRIASFDAPTRAFVGDPLESVIRVETNPADVATAPVEVVVLPATPGEPASEAPAVEPGAPKPINAVARRQEGADWLVAEARLPELPAGRWRLEARVTLPNSADPPPTVRELEVIDRSTRVLLLAGGPTRDFRYLRDALVRDKAFEVSAIVQSGAQTSVSGSGATDTKADEGRAVLDAASANPERLAEYDAIVLFDVDLSVLGEETQAAITRWVDRRAGGLLFVGGQVHTADSVRRRDRNPLVGVLPVEFGGATELYRTAENTEPSRVRVVAGAMSDAIVTPPPSVGGLQTWAESLGVYASSPPGRLKVGATALLESIDPDRTPLLSRSFYGAGRVVYLASGEIWRLRKTSAAWFTRFYVEALRWASRGKLLGGDRQGELYFVDAELLVGDRATLRFVSLNPLGGDSLAYRLRRPDGTMEQRTLSNGAAVSTNERTDRVEIEDPGLHVATLSVDDRDYSTRAVASLSDSELAATTRDTELLEQIAAITGGGAWMTESAAEAGRIADAIRAALPSRAETRTLVGPPDLEFRYRWSAAWGAAVVAALVVEWGLRRAARLT